MNREKEQALLAIKTCKGQLEGIAQMIEEGRYCVEISQQLLAAQSMIKRANKLILTQHLKGCVAHAVESGDAEEKTREMIDILGKLLD